MPLQQNLLLGADTVTGSGPYIQSRSGITSLSAFAVGDIESPMAITLALSVDLTAFLEGPFNGTNMNLDLNNEDLIPLVQPYNAAPWNYSGTESVISIPTDAVDWVLIELRDAVDAASATGATVLDRQAAFVMGDGTIRTLDGISNPSFTSSPSQDLFVLIYHRNHLAVMSSNAVTEMGGIYSWNFTSGAAQAHGGSDGQNEISTGIWGMVGGNGNVDGSIDVADKAAWATETGSNGYLANDYDMDTEANNMDKNDNWLKNNGKSSQIPE